MNELRDRFTTLDRVPVPDTWGDIQRRAATLGTSAAPRRLTDVRLERPRGAGTERSRGRAARLGRRRAVTLLLAAALFIALLGGAFAVGSGLLRLHSVSPPSPDTTPSIRPPAPSSIAGSGSWSVAGSMVEMRFGETATLLADGKVLVAGGGTKWGGHGIARATAELYDPATGNWALTNSMREPRQGHSAVALANGDVLVLGGNASGSAELYDAITSLWVETGRMATARDSATATLLGDGRVLVAGGFSSRAGGEVRGAEIYDPATGAWTATGAMEIARQGHTATLLPDGRALVAGGGCCDQTARGSAELYDPVTGTWTRTGGLASPRVYHTAILLADGKVLVYGGDNRSDHPPITTAEQYDPLTGAWVATGSPHDPGNLFETEGAVHGAAARLLDGRVLAAAYAGADELYDPAIGSWSSVGRPQGDLWTYVHTSTLLAGGRVLVTSEQWPATGGSPTPVAALFDPQGTP